MRYKHRRIYGRPRKRFRGRNLRHYHISRGGIRL